jgi:hypothetical protein
MDNEKQQAEHLGSSDCSSVWDRRRGQRHAESYATPKRIDATDSEQIEYRQV